MDEPVVKNKNLKFISTILFFSSILPLIAGCILYIYFFIIRTGKNPSSGEKTATAVFNGVGVVLILLGSIAYFASTERRAKLPYD